MKNTPYLVRLIVIIFIFYAIFSNNLPKIIHWGKNISTSAMGYFSAEDKAGDEIDEESKPTKIKSEQADTGDKSSPKLKVEVDPNASFIQRTLAKMVETALSNPKTEATVVEMITNMVNKQGFILENDPTFRNIISEDFVIGEGEIAKCGDMAEFEYYTAKPTQLPEGSHLPGDEFRSGKTVIGSNNFHPAIENSILGMKKGGERRSVYPLNLDTNLQDYLKKGDTKDFERVSVRLKAIKPRDVKNNNLRIYTKRNAVAGSAKSLCGTLINGEYSLQDIRGKILQTGNLTFKIGQDLPNKINEALLEIPVQDAEFTIIGLPKDIQQAFAPNLTLGSEFAGKNELVLLNFQVGQLGKTQVKR